MSADPFAFLAGDSPGVWSRVVVTFGGLEAGGVVRMVLGAGQTTRYRVALDGTGQEIEVPAEYVSAETLTDDRPRSTV